MDFFAGQNSTSNGGATKTGAGGMNVVMRLRRTWDVKMPPPSKYVRNNRMVYTGLGHTNIIQRSRKIVLEILGPDVDENAADDSDSSLTKGTKRKPSRGSTFMGDTGYFLEEEETNESLQRRRGTLQRSTEARNFIDLSSELKDDDLVVVRILKPRRGRWGINRDPEDSDDDDDDDDPDQNLYGNEKAAAFSVTGIINKRNSKRSSHKKKSNKWLEEALKEYSDANKYGISREEDWIEYRKFGLDEIKDDDRRYRKTWEATIGIGSYIEKRRIIFKNKEQAEDFKTEIDNLRSLSKERAAYRLEAYKKHQLEIRARQEQAVANIQRPLELATENAGNCNNKTPFLPSIPGPKTILGNFGNALTSVPRTLIGSSSTDRKSDQKKLKPSLHKSASLSLEDDINLLVEIVSCSDLPIADVTSTDPYVVVFLGVNAIHRTDYIPKELNPVWTVHNGSLFMVSCSAEEFFSFSYGLVFCVKDYDRGKKDDLVGRVELTQEQLLSMTGERVAIELYVPQGMRNHAPNRGNDRKDPLYSPKLILRIRKATPADQKFIKKFREIKRSKREAVYVDTTFNANADLMGLLKRESKILDGVELFCVKPGPDPDRPAYQTRWMTKSEIAVENMKPSRSWIESGNGKLGKIFVEVLKCENLPNVMFTRKVKSERGCTDPFCCLVFEDAIGYTDAIRNCTKPRWMPWSQRAFVFNVAHASSNLMIGVFDHGITGYHHPLGRVSVNVTNLSPRTEYVLSFDLYKSALLDNNRKPHGKITIRIRIDFNNRGISNYTLGAASNLPRTNYLNLPNRFEFMTVYYVCHGDEDPTRFSLETLYAYQAELEEHFVHVHQVRQAALTVMFWRGHHKIKIFGISLNVPMHSVVAFLMGITLIENLDLLPSYLLFSIVWLLAATYEARQAHPSPWAGSVTLSDMWQSAIYSKSFPRSIAEFENEEAVLKYEEETRLRYEEEQEIQKERHETAEQLADLYGQGSTEPEDLSAESATKKVGSVIMDKINSVNPLATSLLPIQTTLGNTASFIRILRSILLWDETIYAFIILNASLGLGVLFLFVPWGWLVRWISRLAIWGFLGPWMKLVDLYILPRYFGAGKDKDKILGDYAKEQIDSLGLTKENTLRKREQVYKLRAMKRYMFGKFSVMVPRYKDYRYRDTPLPESSATPISETPEIKVTNTWPGQNLTGEMIPIWGVRMDQRKKKK